MKLFLQKNAKFSSAWGSAPRPPKQSLIANFWLRARTPMFSIFTLAIKFDCLFFTILQSFHLFVGFIFDKLAPLPEHVFQKMF